MTAVAVSPPRLRRKTKLLPYLLSLPALLVCVGILIPFVTAVYYSMLRFRLNLPAMKGFIWFDNYINFLSDAEFWNTVRVSLLYTGLTVGVELVFGLGAGLGSVHCRARRRLGLYAVHYDPAARRPALAAEATLRSRRARRGAAP